MTILPPPLGAASLIGATPAPAPSPQALKATIRTLVGFGVSALLAKGAESVVTFGGMPVRPPIGSAK